MRDMFKFVGQKTFDFSLCLQAVSNLLHFSEKKHRETVNKTPNQPSPSPSILHQDDQVFEANDDLVRVEINRDKKDHRTNIQ